MASNFKIKITEGTLIDTPSEGSLSATTPIQFKGNSGKVFKSMTVNDTSVSPIQGTENLTITASTNTAKYDGRVSNILDGKSTTYYWSGTNQSVGQYILLTLSERTPINLIKIDQDSSDYAGSNCSLQVSDDNTTWKTVGTLTNSSSQSLSIYAQCQYIRLYINSNKSSWWKIYNITVSQAKYYVYYLSDSGSNTSINIIFGGNDILYVKNNSAWKPHKVYKKSGNCWQNATSTYLKSKLSIGADTKVTTKKILKFTNDDYLDNRTLLFEDDFDTGKLNTEIWTAETGYCRNSGAVAYYTSDALSFENSNLIITAKKTSGLPTAKANGNSWALTYTSGSIQSQDKFTFKYGRAQAKLKCPKLAGTWPAWWLFGNNRKFAEYHTDGTILTESGTAWSECGEIDIIEQYGTADQYEWNLWQSQSGASSSYKNGQYSIDPSDWHIYEIEWTPTTIQFLCDGTAVSDKIDITTSQGQAYRNNVDKFFLMLNLQIGGTAGTPTADKMKMYIDWVSIYDQVKNITLTYNCDSQTKIQSGIAITNSTIPSTSKSINEYNSFATKLFPIIGYKFDSVKIVMGSKDITNEVYNSTSKEVVIPEVTDNITITTTTSIDTLEHPYKPSTKCPDGYKELVINSKSSLSLNNYQLNPGYNVNTSSTTVNIEFVLPSDYTFSQDVSSIIVPEELDFSSNITGTSDICNNIINDPGVKGKFPMWNITNYNKQNYFVMCLPISVVGKTISEVNNWIDKHPITMYYKIS